LLADVALSPDKWFAAANLNYAPVFIHNPGRWTTSQPMERVIPKAEALSTSARWASVGTY
jgi:hypothetical protein